MRYPGYDAEPSVAAHAAFKPKGQRPPDYDANDEREAMIEPMTYIVRLMVKPGTPQEGFMEAVEDLLRYECPAVGHLDAIEGWTIAPEVQPVESWNDE